MRRGSITHSHDYDRSMTIDSSMPLGDVKAHLSEVVDQVEREHDRVVITRHGRPAAVVMSADDLASLEETLAVLGSPATLARVRESLAEHADGDAEPLGKDAALDLLRRP